MRKENPPFLSVLGLGALRLILGLTIGLAIPYLFANITATRFVLIPLVFFITSFFNWSIISLVVNRPINTTNLLGFGMQDISWRFGGTVISCILDLIGVFVLLSGVNFC
jgi:formate-dependent nitrite reductase membrane component NrfD